MLYKAFMSYSHAADGKLAPAIQSALHQFAKPWYKLRAIRVFRDKTSLSTNPALWSSIREALSGSEYFLLMASPQAAGSVWVQKEINYWLENKESGKLLIILTDGELAWDGAVGDFDWKKTTALPDSLKNIFAEEPLYLDFRWARKWQQLSLNDPRFRDNIADIAATLHGKPKDELIGEDISLRRKAVRLAWGAVISLFVLFLAALGFGIFSFIQKNEAENQRDIAFARQLASQSELVKSQRTESRSLSILLSAESLKRRQTREGYIALSTVLKDVPRLEKWGRITDDELHSGIDAIALSPDGSLIAASDGNGQVSFWEVPTLKRAELELNPGRGARFLTFSKNGRWIAGHNDQASAILWNAKTGHQIAKLGNEVHSIAFSPDNNFIAAGEKNGLVRLWKISDLSEVLRIVHGKGDSFTNHVKGVSFSPDGKLLATTGEDGCVSIFDSDNGKEKFSINLDRSGLKDVRFSPDGKLFALIETRNSYYTSREGADHHVRIYGAEDGNELKNFIHGDEINVLSFSPDGLLFAAGSSDHTARIWNVKTGEEIALLPHEGPVMDLVFSKDGGLLITATNKTITGPINEGMLRIWSLKKGKSMIKIPHELEVYDVKYSPDGKWVVTNSQSVWRLFNATTGIESKLMSAESKISMMSFSPDGKLLGITDNNSVKLIDLKSGITLAEMPHKDDEVYSLSFSKKDGLLAVAGPNTSSVLDIESGKEMFSLSHGDYRDKVRIGVLSPDGKWMAIGTESEKIHSPVGFSVIKNGKLEVWDIVSGVQIFKADHENSVDIIQVSPDGKVIMTVTNITSWPGGSGPPSTKSFLRLINTDEWSEYFKREFNGVINSADFSTDGSLIALAVNDTEAHARGSNTGWNATVLDSASGREILIKDHGDTVTDAVISPDVKLLATSSADGEVRIWGLSSGKQIGEIIHERPVKALDFSPDGKWLATGSSDRAAYLWKVDYTDLINDACHRLTHNMTIGEWQKYMGKDVPYRCTCANLPPGKGAPTDGCNNKPYDHSGSIK